MEAGGGRDALVTQGSHLIDMCAASEMPATGCSCTSCFCLCFFFLSDDLLPTRKGDRAKPKFASSSDAKNSSESLSSPVRCLMLLTGLLLPVSPAAFARRLTAPLAAASFAAPLAAASFAAPLAAASLAA